jgi:hypothetical protein
VFESAVVSGFLWRCAGLKPHRERRVLATGQSHRSRNESGSLKTMGKNGSARNRWRGPPGGIKVGTTSNFLATGSRTLALTDSKSGIAMLCQISKRRNVAASMRGLPSASGPGTIMLDWLRPRHPRISDWPAPSTAWDLMAREGLGRTRRRRRRQKHPGGGYSLTALPRPRYSWCASVFSADRLRIQPLPKAQPPRTSGALPSGTRLRGRSAAALHWALSAASQDRSLRLRGAARGRRWLPNANVSHRVEQPTGCGWSLRRISSGHVDHGRFHAA